MLKIFIQPMKKNEKSIEALRRELFLLRAGRATPALLDKVMVDYGNAYGY